MSTEPTASPTASPAPEPELAVMTAEIDRFRVLLETGGATGTADEFSHLHSAASDLLLLVNDILSRGGAS